MKLQFRVLVTGSRTWPDEELIRRTISAFYGMLQKVLDDDIEPVLVHGTAQGADQMAAAAWIAEGGSVEAHPAEWETYGKQAGYVRNAEMVAAGTNKQPQICFAFIHNGSRGATMCANLAEKAGIRTYRITAGSQ